ncbi:histamine H2 receptor-like [Actinia tenebrosa]|uniref:Histamine H2 receptor-like n=1 Tax=Actinia tenebrosa TaxID=6105 RepID=A0A6P8HBJ1_ACTTE|nr:histamine H2 receptor-like [Actinia tenebrosa]
MSNSSNTSTDVNATIDTFVLTHTEIIIWSAIFSVLDFLIVVFNLATIVTFIINRHLRRRSVYCLINLAVADMLFGALIMPSDVIFNLTDIYFVEGQYIYCIFMVSSLFSLVLVSLDRVYATFFPFQHRTTRLKTYIAVFTITWILPFLFVLFYGYVKIKQDIVVIVLLLCLLIICTSYSAIFIKVKIQAKRLQPNQQQTAAIQMRQKREHHLAMTLFIATVLSLITWLPYVYILNRIFLFGYNDNIYRIFQTAVLIQNLNSLINPLIYVFRMRDFRKSLSRLIFSCSRDHHYLIVHHGNRDRIQVKRDEHEL